MAVLVGALFFWDHLPLEEKPNPTSEAYSRIRNLILAVKIYAADHDTYPAELDDLADGYLEDDSLLFWVHPKSGEKIPWLYNPGHSNASWSRTPLIAQPVPWDGKRVVGYSGGQVIAQVEDDLKAPFTWPPETAEPPSAQP